MSAAQPARLVPTVTIQPDKIDLADTTRVTLAVEGPSPLNVELPAKPELILAPASAAKWQITPVGTPRIVALEPGRERWEMTYRLSPFTYGDNVTVAFAPLRVNAQDVQFDAQTVRVRKTIDSAKADDAAPATGIETLPPIPTSPADASGWWFLAIPVSIFVAVLVVVVVRRLRAVPPPVPPREWAERELDRLERDAGLERISPREAADRLAGILRQFTEGRFGLPATRLTTVELVAACEANDEIGDHTPPLRSLLEACDRAKFAGDVPDVPAFLEQIGAARAWIGLAPEKTLDSAP
jgi:hypothetical protein